MINFKTLFVVACLLPSLLSFAQSSNSADYDKLDLLFVGDIMGHGPQISAAYDADSKTYDYNHCFKFVKPIIEKADLAIGNLEVTLPGNGPYTGYPMFRSPDALAEAVKNAGFDVVVTSNNHSNDGGYKGVEHTIQVLKKLNLHQTGTFKNQAEKDVYYPLIVYKNGFKLIFLNYTYDTNGLPTREPAVVNLIEEEAIKTDIAAAKALKPDGVIVVMHWGLEYQLNESPVQKGLTEMMYGAGADLVIGAHPHVVQPIKEEVFANENGESVRRVTAYSLGNFISNQQQPNTDGGIMFEVEILKNKKTNKLSIGNHAYIPVWRYIDKSAGKTAFYTLPIAAFEKEETDALPLSASSRAKMAAYAQKTRKNLAKYEGKERKVSMKDLGVSAKPIKVGYENTAIKKGKMPFSYALGSKMGGGLNATKGGEAATVSYFLSLPVSRNPAETEVNIAADTTKPAVETLAIFEPKARTIVKEDKKEKEVVQPKAIPEAYFDPAKVKAAKAKAIEKTAVVKVEKAAVSKSENTAKGGESSKKAVTDGKYTIQFQASRNFYPSASFPFEEVEIEETPSGWYRYYAGTANTLEDAKILLVNIKEKGYPDAFIAKKKVLPNLEKEKDFNTKGESDIIYKVQFQTAKNYYNISPKLFTDVLILEDGELFKYYTGTVYSIHEANELLKEVQAKGFADAFIVTFRRIEERGIEKKD